MRDQLFCLDHGYVLWIDHMGTDLSVVNAARASYMKESGLFTSDDKRLLNWLWREREMSPFRHATMTFEVYAPLMVARQWFKYVVGSNHDPLLGWNESSRRYVTEEPVYYTPWFNKAPASKKQGSGEPVKVGEQTFWRLELERLQDETMKMYERAIFAGIAPEQARVFLLGYGLYVRWRWTCSLQGCIHFLTQRLDKKAQSEIREYAEAVYILTAERFPITMKAFKEEVA
jgi:thymidylate synthase (FAD)